MYWAGERLGKERLKKIPMPPQNYYTKAGGTLGTLFFLWK
jgi:hypothetical protein